MKQKINENAVLEEAVETTTDVNDEVFKQTNVVEETENEPEVKKAEVFGVESQPEEPSKPKQRKITYIGERNPDLSSNENEKEENFFKLRENIKRGVIYWGTVIGYEIQEDTRVSGEDKPTTILIKVKYGDEEVFIPESEYFEPTFKFSYDDNKLSRSELRNEKIKRIQYQLDAEVCFVITYADRKEAPAEIQDLTGYKYEHQILGSRKKAMEVLRDYYFYHRKDKNYPVEARVGDLVNAHVISVRDNMVVVECLGIETRLDEFELSNEVVNNCNDYAKAGDILPVTITKIHLNDEPNKIPYVKVTARSGVFNSNLAKIKTGNVYKGKVSHRNKLKQLYSVVLNNGVVVTIPEKSVIGGLELDRNDNVIVHIKFVKGAYITGTAYKAR